MERVTSLDWALLGLLDQQPRSGYDLRKLFGTTPIARFGDSPGAIYPALRRLERQGLVQEQPMPASTGRGRRVLALTGPGRRLLVDWLQKLPTVQEVERDVDGLILRLAFMSQQLSVREVRAYLDALARVVDEHVAGLERFFAEYGPGMSLSGGLALESGVERFRSLGQWLERVRRRLRARSNRKDGTK